MTTDEASVLVLAVLLLTLLAAALLHIVARLRALRLALALLGVAAVWVLVTGWLGDVRP